MKFDRPERDQNQCPPRRALIIIPDTFVQNQTELFEPFTMTADEFGGVRRFPTRPATAIQISTFSLQNSVDEQLRGFMLLSGILIYVEYEVHYLLDFRRA